MTLLKKCMSYEDDKDFIVARSIGSRDLLVQSLCEEDMKFSENPELLRKRLFDQQMDEALINEGEQDQKKILKVLVVDDEEAIRKLIVTLLSGQGHQCLTVSDGVAALNQAREAEFDAVITDIVMPEMNGGPGSL